MNLKELSDKWDLIARRSGNEIISLRLSSESIPDLFIGISPALNRCLTIKLPHNYIPEFQSSFKQNLSLEIFQSSKFLVLTLLDEQYQDLFDDLILSIYHRIHTMTVVANYTSEFIQTYYKWSEFFHDNRTSLLSEEMVRGLFGELIFLNEILKISDALNINHILRSWKGPYDSAQDFISDEKNTEVKTKFETSNEVRISSEFQLQEEPGKNLELAVVNIRLDPTKGISLKNILFAIRESIIIRFGDYSILLDTLSQKGLTTSNISNYDCLKYTALNIEVYSCVHEKFPKLVSYTLPEGVKAVSYRLNLGCISEYLISNKIITNGN